MFVCANGIVNNGLLNTSNRIIRSRSHLTYRRWRIVQIFLFLKWSWLWCNLMFYTSFKRAEDHLQLDMCLARIQISHLCQLLCKSPLKERRPSNLPGPHLVPLLLLPWQHGSALYPPDFDTILSQSAHCAKGCITGRTSRMPLRRMKVGFPTLRILEALESWNCFIKMLTITIWLLFSCLNKSNSCPPH